MKNFFYKIKARLFKKKYTFTGKYSSYSEAFKTQKLTSNEYQKFLDSYFKIRTKNFFDESKVRIYGRFKFCLKFIKSFNKKKLNILDIGGGSNPIFSYVKKSTNIDVSSHVLETAKFVKYIQFKIPKKYLKKLRYSHNFKNITFKKYDLVFFGSSFQYLKNIDNVLKKIFRNRIKYIIISDIFLTIENKNFFVLGYKDEPLVLPNQFWSYNNLISQFTKNNYTILKETKESAKDYLHTSVNYNSYSKYNLIFKKN